ncbi:DUF4912 domain-containing protein [cf. Phormidesmis sp. LEGE 11477]|nr:DUF4912 domain-containing protein [cf. Phormidesmis sp. LEGE 11477]
MRVNRSTFAKLCLLTALAVPVQRSAFATIAQGAPEVDTAQWLIAQDSEAVGIESTPTATSLEGLTATTNADGLVVIENAAGEVIAGPLIETGGPVTALAFSDDGEILATGTQTGQVRFWDIDGEPQGDIFQPVIGDDNAITELRFEDNETLFVGASQGRQGLWGLDGLPPGDVAIDETGAPADIVADTAEGESEGTPWWVWLIPLIGILGLAWAFLGKRRSQPDPLEARRQTAPTATVPPPVEDLENSREVSSRAQTVISTDRRVDEPRGIDESRVIDEPGLDSPAASVPDVKPLPIQESTDLESSPDLEGTNLDLSTASTGLGDTALDDTALDSAPILGDETLDDSAATDLEDDPWDDELELTLDDADNVDDADNEGDNAAASTPVDLAASILANSLEQEPAKSPAVETPAVETPDETLETSTTDTVSVDAQPLEAPAIPVPLAASDSETPIAAASATATQSLATSRGGIEAIEPTRDTVIAEIETIPDIEPNRETIISDSAVIFDSGAAALADLPSTSTAVAATPEELITNGETAPLTIEELASVDSGLTELPEGYGESRIVLLPRDPEWAYAYWDVSNEHKEQLRQQGGQRLMLRLYDVTDLDMTTQAPHSMQQVDCHEMARSWYLEMPASDRDYRVEIGYLTADDRWLVLAKSAPIRVPPIYPSGWVKDQFVAIDWQEQLAGRSFGDLGQPYSLDTAGSDRASDATDLPQIYDNLFALTQSQEALRVAGSLYGSMQQSLPGALSPSGGPTGPNVSGLNTSGLTMSGIGSGGSVLPERSRKFWLVADAELIVHGATEPDATLTVGDKVIPLNPDGTFRFHIAFPDGQIDYPIRAVAADGEQTRAVHLHFERETPERNTNTKDEAEDEWF